MVKKQTPQIPNSRSMLISMANGGSGHTETWIEGVICEATAEQPEVPAYILHSIVHGKECTTVNSRDIEYIYMHYCLFNGISRTEMPPMPIINTGRHIPASTAEDMTINP